MRASAHRSPATKAAAPYIHPRLSTISANVDGSMKVVPVSLTIVTVPSDRFLTADEVRASMGLPPLEPTEPRLVINNDANEGPVIEHETKDGAA